MKEIKAIISAYREVDISKSKAALATVVKVRGSSYRSPGARMLIREDGRWTGSISGGCLEGDALRKARQVMHNNIAMTVTYDTREESNQNLGIGLGCNGVIDVLIEPIYPEDPRNPINVLNAIVESPAAVALATVYRVADAPGVFPAQKTILQSHDLRIQFSDFNSDLLDIVKPDLIELLESNRSTAKTYTLGNKEIEVFIELLQPSISLMIFGGGFDARPVSAIAKMLGWNVTVTDECVAHIAPAFFPGVDQLSLCDRQFIDRDFSITSYTACVLMSHNYEYDRDVLKKLLKTPTPYIGILGPRKRFDKMKQELEHEGILFNHDDLHRIHSPIGLDIGAETPDEIALSIAAEVQGKFTNRTGGFLKYRKAPIHQREHKSDQVFKQVYLNNSAEEANDKRQHGS